MLELLTSLTELLPKNWTAELLLQGTRVTTVPDPPSAANDSCDAANFVRWISHGLPTTTLIGCQELISCQPGARVEKQMAPD